MVKNDTFQQPKPRFGSGPRVVPSSEHHNEGVMHPRNEEIALDVNKLMEQLGPDLENLNRAPVTYEPDIAALAAATPSHVEKFTASLNKQFTSTANHLAEDIADLERILDILRNRENTLRTAASEVKHNIETWVAYERESNRLTNTLHGILQKGGHRAAD